MSNGISQEQRKRDRWLLEELQDVPIDLFFGNQNAVIKHQWKPKNEIWPKNRKTFPEDPLQTFLDAVGAPVTHV